MGDAAARDERREPAFEPPRHKGSGLDIRLSAEDRPGSTRPSPKRGQGSAAGAALHPVHPARTRPDRGQPADGPGPSAGRRRRAPSPDPGETTLRPPAAGRSRDTGRATASEHEDAADPRSDMARPRTTRPKQTPGRPGRAAERRRAPAAAASERRRASGAAAADALGARLLLGRRARAVGFDRRRRAGRVPRLEAAAHRPARRAQAAAQHRHHGVRRLAARQSRRDRRAHRDAEGTAALSAQGVRRHRGPALHASTGASTPSASRARSSAT